MTRQAILCVASCVLAACGGSPTAPARDWIEIVSITPARGTTLAAGQQVTFTLTASVTLASKDGGYAVLVLSDQGSRTLNVPAGPQAQVTFGKGTRNVTVSDLATAPGSGGTVKATVALFVDGSNLTRALQFAEFSVR